MYYEDGSTYEGEWKNDKRNGEGSSCFEFLGVFNDANKDKYEGEWANDKKNGRGTSHLKLDRHILLSLR